MRMFTLLGLRRILDWRTTWTRLRMLAKPSIWIRRWQKHTCEKGRGKAGCMLIASDRRMMSMRAWCRIACFYLEEYESARKFFDKGSDLATDQRSFKTWARKCDAEIEGRLRLVELKRRSKS